MEEVGLILICAIYDIISILHMFKVYFEGNLIALMSESRDILHVSGKIL